MSQAQQNHPQGHTFSAHRLSGYTDAVVAIAQTLLILPLMEGIGEFASENLSVSHWFEGHAQQLISFALSFTLIGFFWLFHHRMMSEVHRVDGRFLQLNLLWMFSIVWLPVITSLTGQLRPEPLLVAVYAGSLAFSQAILVGCWVYLAKKPGSHHWEPTVLRRSITGTSVAATLFALAAVLGAMFPAINYYALILLMLTQPVTHLVTRDAHRH